MGGHAAESAARDLPTDLRARAHPAPGGRDSAHQSAADRATTPSLAAPGRPGPRRAGGLTQTARYRRRPDELPPAPRQSAELDHETAPKNGADQNGGRMTQTNSITMTIETIDRQQRYVKAQKEKGHGLGVVFADAFLRGMRDIGYKNPAWALAELIDNAVQAAADTIAIRFGFEPTNKTQVKPDQVAICDNGNGMITEMIGYAVRWGGT